MSLSMRLGVNVNTRVPVIFPESYDIDRLLDLAVRAEQLGYDSVWVGDNFFSKARLESITTLSAIAMRTRRVGLGTAALIAPLRHTVWLALAWATLDRIAKGRTVLAVCVGGGNAESGGPGFVSEFDVARVPYQRRGRILEEQIQLLRDFWSPGPVRRNDAFHTLPELDLRPKPEREGGPPIWVSCNPQVFDLREPVVERMLRRVARLADGWMTCTATPAEYRILWERIQTHAGGLGRAPDALTPAYQVTLNVGKDRARARAEGLEYVNAYYTTGHRDLSESMWRRDPFGTAEEVLEHLAALKEAGVATFIFRFASRNQMEQLERFTDSVLPGLRRVS
ncbi:MAG: LLM class flavin-dependent oxidoreductase [Candidatus Tectomicrobia bacterium]|nr:LLM class flavin-dependent oxidoreductase [Candidatus Tectomicrobia bacterium]